MSPKQIRLLEGKVLAAKIQEEILASLADFKGRGLETPGLHVIQVSDDPSAAWYIGQQKKLAEKLGIRFTKTEPAAVPDQDKLLAELDRAGADPAIHGIFLTMPLPAQFDADRVLMRLNFQKDVEGIHPANLGLLILRKARLVPPTAMAAFRLLESSGITIKGKRAVIVGQSAIVGRPLQLLLGERRATTVVCNTGTPIEQVQDAVSLGDIVVACAGSPRMIKGDWIKTGAVVVDVGTTEVEGKLVGDVEFEKAAERADFITPVPGGVGPLTVTMLMQNLILAYRWQKGL